MRALLGSLALSLVCGAFALVACGNSFTSDSPDAGGGQSGGTTGGGGSGGGGAQCAFGEKSCNGQCVKRTDPAFGCGSQSCDPCSIPHAVPDCGVKDCRVGSCEQGYFDCNKDVQDGCESQLNDVNNCGSCEAQCTNGLVCSNQTCATNCGPGTTLCNGTCTITASDPNHCGGCSNICPNPNHATATCAQGECGIQCIAGYGDCDGDPSNGCETPLNDISHCASCTTQCAAPTNAVPECTSGSCTWSCAAGFGDCDGVKSNGCEKDLRSDKNNCGACGVQCTNGVSPACCDGNCVDLDSSTAHCGSCDAACTAGPNVSSTACAAGHCTITCAANHLDCDGDCQTGCECTGGPCADAATTCLSLITCST
jgi:hypothetical protein